MTSSPLSRPPGGRPLPAGPTQGTLTLDDVRRRRPQRLGWPRTILFVEDSVEQMRFMASAMCRALFPDPFLQAQSGDEALRLLGGPARAGAAGRVVALPRVAPDLVLVDSDTTGAETAAFLRHLVAHPVAIDVPVVVLAGPALGPVPRHVLAMADLWLARPTGPAEASDVVHAVHAMWLTHALLAAAEPSGGCAR